MSAPAPPAAGVGVLWRVTSTAWSRWFRLRAGAAWPVLPRDATADAATAHEVEEIAQATPARLRELWQLAEASGGAWGWVLWRLGPPDGLPDGWTLVIDPPAGIPWRYTWVRGADGSMSLVAQTGPADPESLAG